MELRANLLHWRLEMQISMVILTNWSLRSQQTKRGKGDVARIPWLLPYAKLGIRIFGRGGVMNDISSVELLFCWAQQSSSLAIGSYKRKGRCRHVISLDQEIRNAKSMRPPGVDLFFLSTSLCRRFSGRSCLSIPYL